MFRNKHHHPSFVAYATASVLIFVTVLMLSGCGGGGGGYTPPPVEQNPVPAITSLSPATIIVGAAATTVTVTGSGFIQTSTVQWNQTSRSTTFVSSTGLQVMLTAADLAAAGSGNIVVVNPSPGGGTSNVKSLSVNNPAPQISGVSPNPVTTLATGSVLTISGSGFVASSSVTWNGVNHSATYVSSTQLTLTLAAGDVATAGSAQISVVNGAPGGGASNVETLAINNSAPQISGVSPDAVTTFAAGSVLTISGSGFMASSTVTWNGASHAATFVSGTQLTLTLLANDVATTGWAQISVVNPPPGGGPSNVGTLAINNPAPQISLVSPSTVTTVAAGSTLTISGSGFMASSMVTWNGTSHAATYVSGTELTLTLAASDVATVGSAQLSVSNPTPGGGTTSPSTITIVYAVPLISSLTPAALAYGTTTSPLTVSGIGFSSSSVVQVNGVAHATTYVNSTTLTLTLNTSDLASGAALSVTVVTAPPGGGTSAPAILTIAPPFIGILAISPSPLTVNSPDTLVTVSGYGFSASTTVQVNGTTLASNYLDIYTLSFILPSSYLTSVGTLSVVASDPSVGTSNAVMIFVITNPAPTVSSLSPASAAIGGASFTLTVWGSGFVPASTVEWNGVARATTFIDNTQLTVAISAQDIASPGNYSLAVSNPSPGGGLSQTLTFTTYVGLPANDLVYSPATQLLYASVPSSGGASLGNSIVSIDPYTGILGAPIFVGSEPNKLGLSSDGSTLWVSLDGAAAVREVNLNTQSAGLQFSLGGGPGIYNPPAKAQALAVMPGHPDTVAIAAPNAYAYSSQVTIYDSGVARANAQNGAVQCCSGVTGLAFDPTGIKLYEAGSGYGLATVDSTGITAATALSTSVSTNALAVDSGRAYLTDGVILNADTGIQLGVFSIGPDQNASGPVWPDSAIAEGFVLINSISGSGYQINAYDLSTFVLKGAIPVGGINNYYYSSQYPSSLRRWGQDGLAFTTGTQVYVLRSPLVRDLSESLADLKVTGSVPGSITTGANLIYTLTVSNSGPLASQPATLIDSLPSGVTFLGVTPSQGNCQGGVVTTCDLGTLNSGSSATIHITIMPLLAGTLTNTASVSGPQGDPNLANNTVVSTTAVTGASFNPVPTLTSISPDFVQAGSGPLTLTVNGSGFALDSVVRMNSVALPTTFVSTMQLTATADATSVAAMGWSWISVSAPSPGGGTSSSVPLTAYQVIRLDANRLTFDPYTRKLYATIPSTATQVTGNSLVAVDPASGSLGTPLNVGSEPNRLAESTDGRYLYIGLDGSKSLTYVDLTTLTQGPVYPLTVTNTGQVTARDLAVAPGNDNLLAIDTGSWTGIGLFDISGSTGAMRANLTGPYTGSSLAFANGTTLYSYDSDTTGAEFNRWSVTNSGLTLNDNTGYTLTGMGGFIGGYELANGIVYGFGGGVADPTTTPPTQLGQFNVASAQGSGQSIEGSGVAASPSFGRVVYLGETLAGSANPVLLSFDSNRYVLLGTEQFTGSPQGQDLVRWGRDGLAWHSSSGYPFGSGTPGAGQLFLMRGPFVLPQWNMINATPGLSSSSPASITAGSGNLNLAVTGSGFVPGAVVKWNGSERTTTFVDSSHLTVAIAAADLSHTGTASLVANNPGSADSGSISFTIK